jgi:pectate lyase
LFNLTNPRGEMLRSSIAFACVLFCGGCGGAETGMGGRDAAPDVTAAGGEVGGMDGATIGGETGIGGADATGDQPGGGGIDGAAPRGAVDGAPITDGAGDDPCAVPPDPSPLIGWASEPGGGLTTTTGGGGASPTTVTTLAELQNAAKGATAAVIYVRGVLPAGIVSLGSNKTLVGLCGAEIHGHLALSGASNVIIRNLKIVGYAVGNCALDPTFSSAEGCSSGQDAISVSNAHHVWFDHCDISDGTDGNLDITNGSDYVTVSWTKFHYTPRTDTGGSDSTGASGHRFSNLVGGGDGLAGDVGKLNVTWHHNWWAENVMERQPRVRYGRNHVLNNLYTAAGDNYCVRAGIEAQILIENNVFSGVKNPHVFNNTTDQGTAYITVAGNTYPGSTGTQATGGGGTPFTDPPYRYTADPTDGLEAAIRHGAGPK